ncbi:MAG: 1, 4-beta cellobiohydrolase [Candidatus Giovannonibacteria bacterium GW2011_GWC2_44_9]|uniref:1, 4-beta cellobiohydrolase n=2 Tax=Candidatus Giovannoniibacteriota TaxID=1752738 RepID=A0A0G1KHF0_9BACT|nr:MAG: 1, 4-beta cellobiohydrolase [Candidatus Giovannonibacteria bacterium GW2011_GWA1_44_25]KKT82983.1 MAG: 1, 4-beta cellobiohydrolase [Candidatus Giovannonibacteria bacterium GW2011_GWC2_44_9]KKU28555.1 MAG: 1, 4-beta cellobiohydrolase [Candidatus Giovannonibacteria bacterium GW2011_GWB1_46_20]
MKARYGIFIAAGLAALLILQAAKADEFTSSSFKILEPVLQPAGYSTSSGYSLIGTIAQIAIGTSTASSFNLSSGFLFFPFASSPVVTAAAGDGQVSLSWTAATGVLGWTVSGYNVGYSTFPGGPYTFSASLGNVTSSTRTGLTNGTTYYFVVRAEDAFVNSVATSSEVYSTPVAAASTPSPSTTTTTSGGGGGGGGGILFNQTRVILRGYAYPSANLFVLKDGSQASNVRAQGDGKWETDVELAGGIYTFSVYAVDSEGRRSITYSFTTNVSKDQAVTISDIIIPPTIGADKAQVKLGNDIKFFGAAYPNSQINVIINSERVFADQATSSRFGLWNYTLNSANLETGEHVTKSQAVIAKSLVSGFSESLAFRVGDNDVLFGKLLAPLRPAPACGKNGDINGDGKINIVDFSIMLFFWNQRSPQNSCTDTNKDGVVSIFDFSIMLFWWNG